MPFHMQLQRKRSSRLSAKAMRRDFGGDRYDDYTGHGSSVSTLHAPQQQLPSPHCLLDQLPAADLLLMAHISMALQQLSTADVAAAVGMDERSLCSLLEQALEWGPQVGPAGAAAGPSSRHNEASSSGLGGYGSQNPGGSSKHHRNRDAAPAGSAWAAVSAGVGGPQLATKQRQALVGWLQGQCAAPGVCQGQRGPVAAPWTPPPPPEAAPAAAVAAAPAAAAEVAPAAGPSAAAVAPVDAPGQQQQQQRHGGDGAACAVGGTDGQKDAWQKDQQQQQQQLLQSDQQTAAADGSKTHAAAGAAGQPVADGAAANAACTQEPAAADAGPTPMDVDQAAAAAPAAAGGVAAAPPPPLGCATAGAPAAAAAEPELVPAASPAAYPEAQPDMPPQEIAAVAAALVAAASAPPPPAAPDENEAKLAADAAKRADRWVPCVTSAVGCGAVPLVPRYCWHQQAVRGTCPQSGGRWGGW